MNLKENTVNKNKFGHFEEILIKLMKHHYYSATHVAKALGMSTSSITSLIHGNNVPRLTTLQKLADFFDISVGQLIGEIHINFRTNESDKFSIPLITDQTYHQLVHIDQKSINDSIESYTAEEKLKDIIFAYRITSFHYGYFLALNSIILIAPYTNQNGLLIVDEQGYLSIMEAFKDGPIVKLKSLLTERVISIEEVTILGSVRQILLQ